MYANFHYTYIYTFIYFFLFTLPALNDFTTHYITFTVVC